VNPFDEPNVTESKQNTAAVLEETRLAGALPVGRPVVEEDGLRAYGAEGGLMTGIATSDRTVDLPGLLRELLAGPAGSYVGLHAYLAPTPSRDAVLRALQAFIRDRTALATTLGYGPRFLHSTGQLHKGGPPTGRFLQLVAEHPADLPIPGRRESFGTLIDAQALGDYASLGSHGLPCLRVNLGADPDAGLARLAALVERALR
jgi:transaldolase / glucose-6-phosphate isomerase